MLCLYVAENMTKCPLTRGVRLREVSVSGGSTVFRFLCSNTLIYTIHDKQRALMYMLWFNFILGLNFTFHCFKLIIIHYHIQEQ